MPWNLTGNAVTNANFLGTTNAEPLVIRTNQTEAMRVTADGKIKVGTDGSFDSAISYAPFTVTGQFASPNIDTAEVLRIMRHGVSGVKNQNSASFCVGSFEQGENGRSRLDIKVAGYPGSGNIWGSVPDITVMSLLGDGNIGVGTTTKLDPGPSVFLVGDTTANEDGLRVHYNNSPDLRTGVIDVKGLSLRLRGESDIIIDGPSGATERLFIDLTNGNVGIGTTEPSAKFHVDAGSARIDGSCLLPNSLLYDDGRAYFGGDVDVQAALTAFKWFPPISNSESIILSTPQTSTLSTPVSSPTR